jgi:hypothetical protein
MKYYVRKEWSSVFGHYVYRAYSDSEYKDYIANTGEKTLGELNNKMETFARNIPEELGEFDTEPDDQEDVCQDCGEPTDDPDYEYCTECLAGRAELAVESRMER